MNAKTRVLRIIPELNYGGVETRVTQQVKSTSLASEFELTICGFHKEGFAAETVRAAGAEVHILDASPSVLNFRATLALRKYLTKNKFDIVHSSVPEANFHAALAGALARQRCVITEEVGDPSVRSLRGHLLAWTSMRLSHHTIGVSDAVTRYLVDHLRLPRHRVTHINNGVDIFETPSYSDKQKARERFGIAPDAIVVGSVGRMNDKHKRFSDLLCAIAILKSCVPRIHCLLVGDGQDLEILQSHARDLAIDNNVSFVGQLNDIRPAYAAMDVFALLSEQEAFGLVVVEAMISRLPVVATYVGGMSEIVIDGVTGYFVERYSPNDASLKLKNLLESKEKREAMGEAGRERAKEKFSLEIYHRNLSTLYMRLKPSSAHGL